MSLSRGTRLGSCEILEMLGAGGMGEVYRGRDTSLGRDVAVKVLPDAFANDPDRLARFEREAQLLGSLNHPNIAVIHDLKEIDGAKYIILELVEGETLAERIARGPIDISESLDIACQIAEALDAAHEKSIVHRDLKPANVKITPDGRVKVLDFGLAKLNETANAPQSISNSPTLSAMQTMAGVILGTAAYMSPEQIRGRNVDRRSDVWAFGCVLYEMLTGRQAFPNGETVSDTMAGILAREPDWPILPKETPTRVRALLERCLLKDARRRWSDMAMARIEIDESRSALDVPAPAKPTSSRRRETFAWTLTLIFFLTTAALAIRTFFAPVIAPQPVRFDIPAPEGTAFAFGGNTAELSPDGSKLAFVTISGTNRFIWVRTLETSATELLNSTEGAGTNIFWSTDSRYIGFTAENKLKKVAAAGGPAQVLANLPANQTYSGTWNAEGVILLASQNEGPVLRVPPGGGQPIPVTELDTAKKEIWHLAPRFLPDGKHYYYLAANANRPDSATYIGNLDSKERRRLPGIASEVKYAAGYIFFIQNNALMAQPFDVRPLELKGEPVLIVDAFTQGMAFTGAFSISATGSLVYRPSADPRRNTQLAWFDRNGKQLAVVGSPGEYAEIELSPDGKQVAFDRGSPSNVLVLDMEKNLASLLTTSTSADRAANGRPVWSPDGRTIAFSSNREGTRNFYERAVDLVGEDKLLLKGDPPKILGDWSRDGKYMAYASEGDIWAIPLSGRNEPVRLTQTPFNETFPRISPDGRWVAYTANESREQLQVYIQSFPKPGPRKQVSRSGGNAVRWSRDSKEIFYIEPGSTLMSVSVKADGPSLEVGAPVPLFNTRLQFTGGRDYDVSADGRFLMATAFSEQSAPVPITVILNWAAGVKQ